MAEQLEQVGEARGSSEVEERIVEAARNQLAEGGLESVSMRLVADRRRHSTITSPTRTRSSPA